MYLLNEFVRGLSSKVSTASLSRVFKLQTHRDPFDRTIASFIYIKISDLSTFRILQVRGVHFSPDELSLFSFIACSCSTYCVKFSQSFKVAHMSAKVINQNVHPIKFSRPIETITADRM